MSYLFVTLHARRTNEYANGALNVVLRHPDGSEESFRYPFPDPRCAGADNIDDWARELLIQAVELL